MIIDIKKFFKNHLIFLLVFNLLFMILMIIFFNNLKKGVTYSLFIDTKFLQYEYVDLFNNDEKEWIYRLNSAYAPLHKSVLESKEFNENIAIKIFKINPSRFKIIFYTYDTAFDKKNIIAMTNKLISKAYLVNNKNFKPAIEIKINQLMTDLSKKRKKISLNKSTHKFQNKLGLNAIDIYDDVIKENKIDLSRLLNTDIDLITNETPNLFLMAEFVDRFNTLINLQKLYEYYNEYEDNTVNRYSINDVEKDYLYFRNFEYFYLFFGLLISVMSSFLILIFIEFRKKN